MKKVGSEIYRIGKHGYAKKVYSGEAKANILFIVAMCVLFLLVVALTP